jgi:predicted nuclease of predicted toxin-antitoxin system
MKFIADMNISPQTIEILKERGYIIKRVTEFLESNAGDEEIIDLAVSEESTIITQDLDFSYLLAERRMSKPSIVILRINIVKPVRVAKILEIVLPQIESELNKGSIVIVEEERIRIRKLPIGI